MAPVVSHLILASLTGAAFARQHHNHARHVHERPSASGSIPVSFGYENGTHPAQTGAVKPHVIIETVYVTASGSAQPSATVSEAQVQQKNVDANPAQSSGRRSGACKVVTAVVTEYATEMLTVTASDAVAAQQLSSSSSSSSSTSASAPASSASPDAQVAGLGVQRKGYGNPNNGYGYNRPQAASQSTAVAQAQPAASPVNSNPPANNPPANNSPPANNNPPANSNPPVNNPPASSYKAPAASSAVAASQAAGYPVASSVNTQQVAPPAQSSTTPTSNVCKRGASSKMGCVAMKDQRANCGALKSAGAPINWFYDWEAEYGDLSGISYTPMMHGVDSDWLTWWKQSASAKSASHIMNVNEPMITGQVAAGRTVSQSEVEAVFSAFKGVNPNAKVLSPSICGNDAGVSWLQGFNQGYFDIVNAHYYEDCDKQQGSGGLTAFLSSVKSAFNKPIWVTEVGCHPGASAANINKFMTSAIKALESDGSVDRYAWFKADNTNGPDGYLMSGNAPSMFGQNYISSAGC